MNGAGDADPAIAEAEYERFVRARLTRNYAPIIFTACSA